MAESEIIRMSGKQIIRAKLTGESVKMNALLSHQQNQKTNADQNNRLLQLQAADALRAGDFQKMFKLDQLAEQSRIKSHNRFFENGLNAVARDAAPKAKPATAAAATATVPTRRVIKLAR